MDQQVDTIVSEEHTEDEGGMCLRYFGFYLNSKTALFARKANVEELLS